MEMPGRTRSNGSSRNRRIPALFSAWTATPVPNAFRTAGSVSRKVASCAAVYSRSSAAEPSAEERCVIHPSSRRAGVDAIRPAASMASRGSSPSRPIPVSTLTCTGKGRPSASAARARSPIWPRSNRTAERPWAWASAACGGSTPPSTTTGRRIPPSRSSTPSSTVATPSIRDPIRFEDARHGKRAVPVGVRLHDAEEADALREQRANRLNVVPEGREADLRHRGPGQAGTSRGCEMSDWESLPHPLRASKGRGPTLDTPLSRPYHQE